MGKNLRRNRLQVKPKTRLKTSIRLVIGAASVFLIATVSILVYQTFFIKKDSMAREQFLDYLPEFGYKRSLTIQAGWMKNNTTQYNQVAYLEIIDDELKWMKHGGKLFHPKAWDFCITKKNGYSKVPFAIDHYRPESGKLALWLLLDTVPANVAQEFYIYYAKPGTREGEYNKTSFLPQTHIVPFEHQYTSIPAHKHLQLQQAKAGFELNQWGHAVAFAESGQPGYLVFQSLPPINTFAHSFTMTFHLQLKKDKQEQLLFSNAFRGQWGLELSITKENKLSIIVWDEQGKAMCNLPSKTAEAISKNRWYHVALIYKAAEKQFQLYLDGIKDSELKLDATPVAGNEPLRIGGDPDRLNLGLHGLIDQWTFTPAAMQDWQVASHFVQSWQSASYVALGKTIELNASKEEMALRKQNMELMDAEALAHTEREQNPSASKFKNASQAQPLSSQVDQIKQKLEQAKRNAADANKSN